MKIIEYKCEICRESYNQELAVKQKQVKALFFRNMKDFEIKDLPADCDTHICITCLNQLKNQL